MLSAPSPRLDVMNSGFVLRPIRSDEGAALQGYFRRLSSSARYYRLLGAASELPVSELARALAADGVEMLSLLLVHRKRDCETIVGEARAAFSLVERTGEFAMSIAEDWRRLGLGAALLSGIERLAAAGGVDCLFGEVLRDNVPMISLARSRGFRLEAGFEARLVRARKQLSPREADALARQGADEALLGAGVAYRRAPHWAGC